MQQHVARARAVFLGLLLVLSCCCWVIIAEPACKQQGLLMLDEAHPPYRMRLPFCDKYKCSCCNASHALAIQRSVQHLLLDEELGLSCKAGLVMLACRLCDPQVGVGNVTSVCQSTCDSVYEACSEDYFAFDESSGDITPCTSQLSSSLVCSQLQQIAPGGEEFCRAAGYRTSQPSSSSSSSNSLDHTACFDGSPVAADKCSSEAPLQKQRGSSTAGSSSSSSSSRTKRRSKRSSSSSSSGVWPFSELKRRHKRMLAEVAQLLAGALTSTLVALGIVLLLQRVMQPAASAGRAAARGQQGVPRAASSRDRLAQAAEARATLGAGTAAAAPAASAAQQAAQQQQQQPQKKRS